MRWLKVRCSSAGGSLITGREQGAQNVLNGAMLYLQHLQQEGMLDSIEAVALEPHGGDLNGFVLVKGDKEALAKVGLTGMQRVALIVRRESYSRAGSMS
jgi:hypothetical protein